jgi:predicted DNA-binding transcriptional regulator AlpA
MVNRSNALTERLLDVCELAERWGISAASLYHRVARRQVPPPIRIGSLLRWRLEDVVGWEDGQKQVEVDFRQGQRKLFSGPPLDAPTLRPNDRWQSAILRSSAPQDGPRGSS